MKNKILNTGSYGEVLWDLLPQGKKIGGAPLNVALRMASLGAKSKMISAVGDDENGRQILTYAAENEVGIEGIQLNDWDTGVVNVVLDAKGAAEYTIAYPVAWDKIAMNATAQSIVEAADVFIFGSLACRDEVSRTTLHGLLGLARYKVFDVNLRKPHCELQVLKPLLQSADFIKMNDDELYEICRKLGSPFNSLDQNLKFLKTWSRAKTICATLGEHGAVLYHEDQLFYHGGYKTQVKDTVGAGDSFLATLLIYILQGKNPQEALDNTCAMGAMVASHDGANPQITQQQLQDF
ncbi:MAG: carbohydrate kinase [Cytophagaceae bacterium]|nr:carbohydrate kinase [Cytophagaceae bacterium]